MLRKGGTFLGQMNADGVKMVWMNVGGRGAPPNRDDELVKTLWSNP